MEPGMSGCSRTIAAVLAVALGAALPATCPCAPQTQTQAGHECCASFAALRAAADDCCSGATSITEALSAAPAPELALASPASCGLIASPRVVSTLAVRATTVAPSPPSLVLRI